MAFTIDICKTSDNVLKYNKSYTTLSPVGGVSIDATQSIDQINPTFIINYDPTYIECNYVVASFLGAAYFATPIVEPGKRITLKCSIDPLSYNLDSCPGTVLRNGGIGKPTKMQDTKLPIITNEQTITQTVSANEALTPYGDKCYVLTVIGGAIT